MTAQVFEAKNMFDMRDSNISHVHGGAIHMHIVVCQTNNSWSVLEFDL